MTVSTLYHAEQVGRLTKLAVGFMPTWQLEDVCTVIERQVDAGELRELDAEDQQPAEDRGDKHVTGRVFLDRLQTFTVERFFELACDELPGWYIEELCQNVTR